MRMVTQLRSCVLVVTLAITLCEANTQDLKTISFNIRFDNEADSLNKWAFRKSSVIDFIEYESPDFLGLQEALINQINDIEEELDNYQWVGVGRDDGKLKGEFSPIFYFKERWSLFDSDTFWLSDTPDSISKSWDAALPRICTWGKFYDKVLTDTIFVFNTHYDHVGTNARLNSSKLILKRIDQLSAFQNTILMGDFNGMEIDPEIRLIYDSPLSDAFLTSTIRYGEIGTYNGFNVEEVAERRIDYVFLGQDLKPLSYSTDSRLINGRFLSDHFPVIVELIGR